MNGTLHIPSTELKTPWQEGGTWQLWGPTFSEIHPAAKVDLAIFRMTGEWPVGISVDSAGNGYLVKTHSKWVFAAKA